MTKTPTGQELIKRLVNKFGCNIERHGKGSHCQIALIRKNGTKLMTTVQMTNKELSKGVVNSISRKLKIPKEELVAD